MFSYPDAARYRVGPNYQQLPVNRPISKVYAPYQRDGPATINGNYGADPDYIRSEFIHLRKPRMVKDIQHDEWVGRVTAYTSEVEDDDYEQARMLWEIMGKEGQQQDLLNNVAKDLGNCIEGIRKDAVGKLTSIQPPINRI